MLYTADQLQLPMCLNQLSFDWTAAVYKSSNEIIRYSAIEFDCGENSWPLGSKLNTYFEPLGQGISNYTALKIDLHWSENRFIPQ